MKPFRALVFDFETTGLTLHPQAKLSLQPRAIEFGGVIIERDGTVVRELSYIVDPEQEIEPIITKITGLTNADLKGKPLFAAILPALREAFGMVDLMIAHNLPFDRDILELELRRLDVNDFPWPRYGLCTVQCHQEAWGHRPKLVQLYEEVIGEKFEQKHRAKDDCDKLARIVVKEGLMEMFV